MNSLVAKPAPTVADQRAAKIALYGASFIDFVKAGWHVVEPHTTLKMNWHIEAIADHLQAQSQGELQRLIINVPPGSCKSLLAGVFWPCWEWTHSPGVRILAAAASTDLSDRDNQRARLLLRSPWYQDLFPLQILQDSDSKEKFTNEHLGHRAAVAFTSTTGHRGDRVIIDDAISAANSDSDTMRERVNRVYFDSITTRLNQPKSSTITIIQQRLHENDLVGAILEKDSRFEKLILPMEYVPTTYVTGIGFSDPRTEPGELMFEEHWGEEEIAAFKAEGPYKYSSQFQQNPVPDTGGFFDTTKFNRFQKSDLPTTLHHYLMSDHAVSDKSKSDYNVVRVWAVDAQKNLWLVDSYREAGKGLKAAMGIGTDDEGKLKVANSGALAFVAKYKPLKWFAEPDNNFKGIQSLVKDTMIATGHHCTIEFAIGHKSGKGAKAAAYQSLAELGKVYLPHGKIGDEALLEYATFPVGRHDDQVDADAILPRMMNAAHAAVVPPAPQGRSPTDDYVVERNEGEQPGNWNMFF